jgi:hypothetical protein
MRQPCESLASAKGACHPAVKTQMVEFAVRDRRHASMSRRPSLKGVGKRHGQILIPTRETSRPRVPTAPNDTTAKLAARQEAQQLREDGSTLFHGPSWIVSQTSVSKPVAVQIAFQSSARKALVIGEVFVSRTAVIHFYPFYTWDRDLNRAQSNAGTSGRTRPSGTGSPTVVLMGTTPAQIGSA